VMVYQPFVRTWLASLLYGTGALLLVAGLLLCVRVDKLRPSLLSLNSGQALSVSEGATRINC
jgi:hypothetical protein